MKTVSHIKEFVVEMHPKYANSYVLKWAEGGEIPAELSGKYTSKAEALVAGESYLSKRDKKRPRKVVKEEE